MLSDVEGMRSDPDEKRAPLSLLVIILKTAQASRHHRDVSPTSCDAHHTTYFVLPTSTVPVETG